MTRIQTSEESRIAVLGLGRMGTAVATRLARQGHRMVGWTRSGRAVRGLTTTPDIGAAVTEAELVVLCLFDGTACRDVIGQIGDRLAGTTVVNTSTVGVDEAESLATTVRAAGARYVHAPVIGSVAAVAAGTLRLLVSGDIDDRSATIFADLGDVLTFDDIRGAASAKLVANGVLAGSLLVLRDGRRRAIELGIDGDQAWTVLEQTAPGVLVKRKRERLDSGKFGDADFTVGAFAKDLDLLARSAPGASRLRDEVAGELTSGVVDVDDDVAALLAAEAPPSDEQSYGLTVAPTVTAPDEVLEPLRAYVAAHATGDAAHHRRAFLPSAHIEGLRDGQFVSWTLDDYCALFSGEPEPDEPTRRRRIEHVSVTGTVGTATMTLWHGPDVFTDAFLLVQVEGSWRIANKIYHREAA